MHDAWGGAGFTPAPPPPTRPPGAYDDGWTCGLPPSAWHNASRWRCGDPCIDLWQGVECDAQGRLVGLDLEGKGLSGVVTPALLASIPALRTLRSLKLAGNRLAIRGTTRAAAWPPGFVMFIDEICSVEGQCTGLPPYSCTAFGDWARLKFNNPQECDPCDGDESATYALIIVAMCAVIGMLVLYVVVILRYPEMLRRWVSFILILANHTQTLSIFGALDLAWPPVIRKILSVLTLFQIDSASCLLPPNVPSFWIYAFAVMGLALLTIGTTTLVLACLEMKGATRHADRTEFILSIVYATGFVYAYQVCVSVLRQRGSLKEIALSLMIPLTTLLCGLLLRFWFKLDAFSRALSGGGWQRGGWFSSKGIPTQPSSLHLRVFYLTHRFARHAQRWQFAIWLRQLALILAIGAIKLITTHAPAMVEPLRYPSVAIFLVIIAIALWGQLRVAPYAYRLQNHLEAFLMFSNLVLLAFAIGCQQIADVAAQAGVMREDLSNLSSGSLTAYDWLEVLMLALLALSLVFILVCLAYDVIQARRELGGLDPSMVVAAADHFIDEPIAQALKSGSIRLLACPWLLYAADDEVDDIINRRRPPTDEAFVPPEAAVEMLLRADRSILVVSHAEGAVTQPDPFGKTRTAIRTYLEAQLEKRRRTAMREVQQATGDGIEEEGSVVQGDPLLDWLGVYWDAVSLCKAPDDEQDGVSSALSIAQSNLFASTTGTCVLQIVERVPPRPREHDGAVLICDYSKVVQTRQKGTGDDKASKRKRLEEWLHIFGKFHSIEEVGKKLVVHFARHADAEQVVKHPRISATLLYDERHYMARPRCILEQGMAMLAASHCYHVFKYSHPSARLLQAEATRPKLVKLKDGNATAATCKERPQAILTRTTASLMGASFVDKLERERLTALLANIEFFQNRAMDEAQQLMQLDRFSVSRDLLTQLRKITAVTLPARPWSIHETPSAAVAVDTDDEAPYKLSLTASPCRSGVLCVGNGGPESDAERAGLHVGSVIIAVNGEVTRSVRAVTRAIHHAATKDGIGRDRGNLGQELVLTLARKTRQFVIDRTEAMRKIGIMVVPSPRSIGALIIEVAEQSLGQEHGLRVGDTILSCNGVYDLPKNSTNFFEQIPFWLNSVQLTRIVTETYTKDIKYLVQHNFLSADVADKLIPDYRPPSVVAAGGGPGLYPTWLDEEEDPSADAERAANPARAQGETLSERATSMKRQGLAAALGVPIESPAPPSSGADVQCGRCFTLSWSGAKFCRACGHQFEPQIQCSQCHFLNQGYANFCGECGCVLTKPDHAEQTPEPAARLVPPPPPPKRQQASSPWMAATDPASGHTYYYNTVTRKSQWEEPTSTIGGSVEGGVDDVPMGAAVDADEAGARADAASVHVQSPVATPHLDRTCTAAAAVGTGRPLASAVVDEQRAESMLRERATSSPSKRVERDIQGAAHGPNAMRSLIRAASATVLPVATVHEHFYGHGDQVYLKGSNGAESLAFVVGYDAAKKAYKLVLDRLDSKQVTFATRKLLRPCTARELEQQMGTAPPGCSKATSRSSLVSTRL